MSAVRWPAVIERDQTARVLRGAPAAAAVLTAIAARAAQLRAARLVPTLAIITVGDDPASAVYVRKKGEACEAAGLAHRRVVLPTSASATDVRHAIRSTCDDRGVHGVIVQLPLPRGLDGHAFLGEVDPAKDVDGLSPASLGALAAERPTFVAATPLGIALLLRYHGIQVVGQHVAVVGRSVLVGRTLAQLLSLRRPGFNATVTLCHSGTRDLAALTRTADIIVSATGVPGTITAAHVGMGATVVDVGTTRVEDPSRPGRFLLVGDVLADQVAAVAGALTPVPGGVGPMTVACLLANTVYAADPTRGPIGPIADLLGASAP